MTMLEELRVQIGDTRYVHAAFTLAIGGSVNVRATVEVTNYGNLVVTVLDGIASSTNIDLSSSLYNTVGALTRALQQVDGYIVNVSPDADLNHAATDIEPFGPVHAGPGTSGASFNTRLFSDAELVNILQAAAKRHNPSFSNESVPESERSLVLTLAKIDICRRQAMESSKRRGLSLVVSDLLAVADSMENTYYLDIKRLQKAIHSPPELPTNTMGDGDIVSGTLMSRSLRTGYLTSRSQNLKPATPEMLSVEDADVEDTNVRIRWARNRDVDFHSYELWMNHEPNVARDRRYVGTVLYNQAPLAYHERGGTSKMVYSSAAARRTEFDIYPVVLLGTIQAESSFVVSELEPDSDYWFRVYVTDQLSEAVGSEVLYIHTKPLRTIIHSLSLRTALPGTVVTINTMGGALTAQNQLFVDNKEVALTVVDPTTGTFVVPSFVNKRLPKDISLVSPSGLKSVFSSYFVVK